MSGPESQWLYHLRALLEKFILSIQFLPVGNPFAAKNFFRMASYGDEQSPLIERHERKELGRWNSSTLNALRVSATFWSFIISGANDSLYGVGLLRLLHPFLLLTTLGSHSTGIFFLCLLAVTVH